MVITRSFFQLIGSDQISIQDSFDDVCKGGGLDADKLLKAELTFVPKSISFAQSFEFFQDYDVYGFSDCVKGD